MAILERAPTAEHPSAAARRPRFWLGIGLSLLSGLLAVWSLEDFHVEFLVFVAFVPAIVAQHRVLPRRWSGLALGIAIGMMFQGYMGPGLSNADLPWYFYIYGVWIALIVAVIAWRGRSFNERTGYRWLVVSAPVAWVALEFLRSTQSETFAGTWGNVSYALYERPGFLQPISITGMWGVNLLILVVNWTLAALVIAALDRRAAPPQDAPALEWYRARRWATVVAGVVAVWTIGGMAMMAEPPATVRVAAVQPGSRILADAEWEHLSDAEELAVDIRETERAAALGADLVVWRESGLAMDLRDPDVNEPIRAAADDAGVYIAAGWGGTYDGLRLNEVATFSPDGEFLGTYGKSHPGTFAGDFSDRRGGYIVYETAFGNFGSIICYDLDFTDSARTVARKGANIIAVSSSDVPGIAQKHYAHLVFRSIETGLPTVKADSTFDSSIIDPHGRIIDRHVSPTGSQATLVADIPVGDGDTLYVRWGDWLGLVSVGSMLVFAALGGWTRIRRRRQNGNVEP